ncbi:MAG: hypothetical protein A2Y63_01865 [Candidatus Riflebacteria bacterium RBG_13_59_9]|nr:MAG: hypothetical protein A2Y63_01865 [Candidatus Riflebacteria bacterium RBG_13_59_9]
MRAYNTNIAILLPRVRIDWIGVNLEDFMRRVLLAAKSAQQGNLYYSPYPLARIPGMSDMALADSREVVRSAENQLAKYVVLPEEATMITLYKRLMRDASRASYPRQWSKVDFHSRYLPDAAFPALTNAFDALFWFLVWNTALTLTVAQGLEVVQAFFLDEQNTVLADRAAPASERFRSLRRQGFQQMEADINLSASPFPVSAQFIIVGDENAPIEGTNTVFVSFHEEPLRVKLACRVLTDMIGEISPSPSLAEQVRGRMLALVEERLGSLPYELAAGETKSGVAGAA